MSRVHLLDLKNPDQKRKAVDQGDPHTRFIAKMAERSGNILSLASGVLAVRHSTFALCLMAVWTQACSSCKCCFPYCKIQRSTPVHILCVFVFDLLLMLVFSLSF